MPLDECLNFEIYELKICVNHYADTSEATILKTAWQNLVMQNEHLLYYAVDVRFVEKLQASENETE